MGSTGTTRTNYEFKTLTTLLPSVGRTCGSHVGECTTHSTDAFSVLFNFPVFNPLLRHLDFKGYTSQGLV